MNSPAHALLTNLHSTLAGVKASAERGIRAFEQAAAPAMKHLDDILGGNVRKFIRPGGRINAEARTTAALLIGLNKTLNLGLNEKNLEVSGTRVNAKYEAEIKKFQRVFNDAIEAYKKDPESLKKKNPELFEKIDALVKSDPNYATKKTSRWLDFRLTVDGVVGNWTGTVLKALSTDDGKMLLYNDSHVNTLNIIAGGYWVGETAKLMPEAKRNRDDYSRPFTGQYDENGNFVTGPYESYSPLRGGYRYGRAVTFRHGQDANRVNPNLVAALNQAAEELGFRQIYVGTAITGHGYYTTSGHVSRHNFGWAFDIASIDGYPCNINNPQGARNADRLVAWLEAHGFRRNSESGNARAVLWRFDDRAKGGNHNNHIHASWRA